jgi:hypothetical protein
MPSFRKITSRDKPETLARAVAAHEEHLRAALVIATRRAARSKTLVRELLSKATIEGRASLLNSKVSAITFVVPQFKETWHQLIPWQHLANETPAETATSIAWSLRENIRRHEQDRKVTARANSTGGGGQHAADA